MPERMHTPVIAGEQDGLTEKEDIFLDRWRVIIQREGHESQEEVVARAHGYLSMHRHLLSRTCVQMACDQFREACARGRAARRSIIDAKTLGLPLFRIAAPDDSWAVDVTRDGFQCRLPNDVPLSLEKDEFILACRSLLNLHDGTMGERIERHQREHRAEFPQKDSPIAGETGSKPSALPVSDKQGIPDESMDVIPKKSDGDLEIPEELRFRMKQDAPLNSDPHFSLEDSCGPASKHEQPSDPAPQDQPPIIVDVPEEKISWFGAILRWFKKE